MLIYRLSSDPTFPDFYGLILFSSKILLYPTFMFWLVACCFKIPLINV